MQKNLKALFLGLFILLIPGISNASCGCDSIECPCEAVCWEGFYLNGQLGMGWGQERDTYENSNYFNTLGPTLLGSKFDFNPKGLVAGGSFGYNYEYNFFLIGLEAGALGLNLKKSEPSPFFQEDVYSRRLTFLIFTKARAGFTFGRFLTYVSGGWAGSDPKLELLDTNVEVVSNLEKWVNGWTVGGGIEYMLRNNFSLGIAYDYYQLGLNHQGACPRCRNGVGFGSPKVKREIETQTLLFKVSYYF